jgi:hypothetical protein
MGFLTLASPRLCAGAGPSRACTVLGIGGEPVTTYYGRVMAPSEGRQVMFRLGTKLRSAQKKMGAIANDPDKAFAEKTRPKIRRIAFDNLTEEFLRLYRSRGDSGYYDMVNVS